MGGFELQIAILLLSVTPLRFIDHSIQLSDPRQNLSFCGLFHGYFKKSLFPTLILLHSSIQTTKVRSTF